MTDIYGYAAAAPLYRAAGWMQVIPLPEGRKTPPPSGFTGRSRKPVTDEQVRFWSQSDPTANTGIVIPEGVLVLDIDAEQGHRVKADGAKGISELSQELGALPAVDPPERRNVLLVHAQRRNRQHAPPHQRLGDTAMEVGGLPAQTRQHGEPDTFKPVDHSNRL